MNAAMEPRIALSLMAHPDDAEVLAGGTLALLRERGWSIHICSATPGDAGTATQSSEEIAAIRRREGEEAAAVLDGEFHCLERRDLRIFYDEDGVRRVTSLLRKVRPALVFAHGPSDYMLDHEEISKLARAACFNAPIPNAPVLEGDGAAPLESIPVLLYADAVEGIDLFGRPVTPTFGVDVTATFVTKMDMLSRHSSQREWLRSHHGMDEYLDSVRRWGEIRGRELGVEQAEVFRQHLGHPYPRENILRTELGDLVRDWPGLA